MSDLNVTAITNDDIQATDKVFCFNNGESKAPTLEQVFNKVTGNIATGFCETAGNVTQKAIVSDNFRKAEGQILAVFFTSKNTASYVQFTINNESIQLGESINYIPAGWNFFVVSGIRDPFNNLSLISLQSYKKEYDTYRLRQDNSYEWKWKKIFSNNNPNSSGGTGTELFLSYPNGMADKKRYEVMGFFYLMSGKRTRVPFHFIIDRYYEGMPSYRSRPDQWEESDGYQVIGRYQNQVFSRRIIPYQDYGSSYYNYKIWIPEASITGSGGVPTTDITKMLLGDMWIRPIEDLPDEV